MCDTKMVPTIESIDEFRKHLPNFFGSKDQRLALLLDFDGTLAPITPHPNFTVMTDETSEVLNNLCSHSKIFAAVISGRGLNDVKQKVGIEGIVYAGNHGLEILYIDGRKYNHHIPSALQKNFTLMRDRLKDEIEKNGAWIEDKIASLTVHYREAPEEQHDEIAQLASDIIESYGYTAHQALKATEAKPPVQWNKGKAALLILESNFGENWHEKVKTVFVGDDITDEDAMMALSGKGVTFRVSSNPEVSTHANYRLPSTVQVHELLQWISQNIN